MVVDLDESCLFDIESTKSSLSKPCSLVFCNLKDKPGGGPRGGEARLQRLGLVQAGVPACGVVWSSPGKACPH